MNRFFEWFLSLGNIFFSTRECRNLRENEAVSSTCFRLYGGLPFLSLFHFQFLSFVSLTIKFLYHSLPIFILTLSIGIKRLRHVMPFWSMVARNVPFLDVVLYSFQVPQVFYLFFFHL